MSESRPEPQSSVAPSPAGWVSPTGWPTFTPPEPGQVVPNETTGNTYRIGRRLGEGHFGVVFECTDTWGNELAVKVLKPRGTYDEVRSSAIGEIQRLLVMRHPNITYVYDGFEYRHTFYIVFERCWKSINDFISEWPAAPNPFYGRAWIRPIARQVLQAVHFLHSQSYIHQDIHGGNVFIASMTDEMNPNSMIFTFMLGDLGISKMATEVDVANTMLAEWMRAPETLQPSEFGVMDHRMDIYHCGLLFLQILLGKPVTFTTDEVLAGAPRALALSLETPYKLALEKALRRHVDYRTASALELWRDLNSPP